MRDAGSGFAPGKLSSSELAAGDFHHEPTKSGLLRADTPQEFLPRARLPPRHLRTQHELGTAC